MYYISLVTSLPTGLYILLALIASFLNGDIISGSTRPIIAIFAPNDRYLFECDQSGPLF